MSYDEELQNRRLGILGVAALALLGLLAIVYFTSLFTLGVGEVAVIVDPIFGSVSEPRVGPAISFKLPWQYVIKDFYTIDYIELSTARDADYPPINALTRDGVSIQVEATFTYSLEPSQYSTLVRFYPRLDYESQRLVPILTEVVRNVISRYTVEEVITLRDRVANEIENEFRASLRGDETLSAIRVQQINLKSIVLPAAISKSIEDKIAALQRRLAAEFEAERIRTLAVANATAAIIRAQAQGNATLIIAEAQREALVRLLTISGDAQIARLWMMQYLPSANIVVIMGGNASAVPLLVPSRS